MAEDSVVRFLKEDLPKCAFPMFEDIRRQGKLCDVTLRVRSVVPPSIMSITTLYLKKGYRVRLPYLPVRLSPFALGSFALIVVRPKPCSLLVCK